MPNFGHGGPSTLKNRLECAVLFDGGLESVMMMCAGSDTRAVKQPASVHWHWMLIHRSFLADPPKQQWAWGKGRGGRRMLRSHEATGMVGRVWAEGCTGPYEIGSW